MPQEVEHNNNNNQEEPRYGIFYGGDDYEDSDSGDESDSEGDIPLSPPRSPPRDLDPDKLYGLYDFSGPDPSHCTLSVDEPVYLINDEDNYWWLIRKLTKLERLKRMRLNGQEFQIDIESDEEDGKIGFVPAECLETHGERLARLNCFKNEELEKKSPTPSSLQESTDSFKNQQIKSDHENIRQNLDLYNNLEPPTHLQEIKEPEVLSDVYPAETPLIISKNNNNNKDSSNKTATPTFQMSNTFDAVFVQPKQRSSGLFDDASIGSYSPDTPVKAKSPLRVEVQDDDSDEMGRNNSLSSMSSLRRSVILDRLTQMTSDIQEQLQLDGYNEDEDEDEEEQEEDAGEVEEELDEDKHKEDDETEKESTDVEQGSSRDSDHEVHGFSFEESSEQFTSDDDYDDDDDDNVEHHSPSNDETVEYNPEFCTTSYTTSSQSTYFAKFHRSPPPQSHQQYAVSPLNYNRLPRSTTSIDDETSSTEENNDDNITPLTSMNSLTPIEERRKSKPVHEMFMPILGKFDELAEKLAELDDIL
ncbi:SH3 domain family protein [Candida albicans]|uniref:SH3 domain family protein n=1 Tax=Candida albicans TaxID=5476 RepID=A0A8H6F1L6_CANAX|nr:SH3 domain family protein [Candida albicans]